MLSCFQESEWRLLGALGLMANRCSERIVRNNWFKVERSSVTPSPQTSAFGCNRDIVGISGRPIINKVWFDGWEIWQFVSFQSVIHSCSFAVGKGLHLPVVYQWSGRRSVAADTSTSPLAFPPMGACSCTLENSSSWRLQVRMWHKFT